MTIAFMHDFHTWNTKLHDFGKLQIDTTPRCSPQGVPTLCSQGYHDLSRLTPRRLHPFVLREKKPWLPGKICVRSCLRKISVESSGSVRDFTHNSNHFAETMLSSCKMLQDVARHFRRFSVTLWQLLETADSLRTFRLFQFLLGSNAQSQET